MTKAIEKKKIVRKTTTKKRIVRAAVHPPTAKTVHAKGPKRRPIDAIRRDQQTASNDEFEAATAAVLVVVAGLAAESA